MGMGQRSFTLALKEIGKDLAPQTTHQEGVLLVLEGRSMFEGNRFIQRGNNFLGIHERPPYYELLSVSVRDTIYTPTAFVKHKLLILLRN